jgi:hypothetical protein
MDDGRRFAITMQNESLFARAREQCRLLSVTGFHVGHRPRLAKFMATG